MTKYFQFCPVHGTYKRFDLIVRETTQEFGCVSCFYEAQGIPEPHMTTAPPPKAAVSEAAASQTNSNRAVAENLSHWKRSGDPERWVKEHHGAWNDADWTKLIGELITDKKYWPMKPKQVGQALEEQKARYWKKTRHAT